MCTEGQEIPVGSHLGHTLNSVYIPKGPHHPGCKKEKVRLASLHTEAYKRWGSAAVYSDFSRYHNTEIRFIEPIEYRTC